MSQNYGDVALQLPPTWSRAEAPKSPMQAMNIGHRHGVADVYLTKKPDERHQFAWVDLNHETDLDNYRDLGYEFVTKSEWTASRWRWAEKGDTQWNAEGKLRGPGNQYLMARPERLYIEECEAKDLGTVPVNPRESALEFAEKSGIAIEDGTGRLLNRIAKS